MLSARFIAESEHDKRLLKGAVMLPSHMTSCGPLGASAEAYMQRLAHFCCFPVVADRGIWLRITVSDLCFGSGARNSISSILQGCWYKG